MDKLKETLEKIFIDGPEPKDFLVVFGLIVACIVIVLGTLWSFGAACVYLLVGLFTLNFIKLLGGLFWCLALAFFVAIIIVVAKWFDDIVY